MKNWKCLIPLLSKIISLSHNKIFAITDPILDPEIFFIPLFDDQLSLVHSKVAKRKFYYQQPNLIQVYSNYISVF